MFERIVFAVTTALMFFFSAGETYAQQLLTKWTVFGKPATGSLSRIAGFKSQDNPLDFNGDGVNDVSFLGLNNNEPTLTIQSGANAADQWTVPLANVPAYVQPGANIRVFFINFFPQTPPKELLFATPQGRAWTQPFVFDGNGGRIDTFGQNSAVVSVQDADGDGYDDVIVADADKKQLNLWGKFPTTPGVYELSVEAGGLTRWFVLVIPPGYDHSQPVPLVITYHGGGGGSRNMWETRSDLITLAEQDNFMVAFAQGTNFDEDTTLVSTQTGKSGWNAVHCCTGPHLRNVDDIAYTEAMIQTLAANLQIDTSRVYATGFSNGGMLVHRLAAERPDLFAAIAVTGTTVGGQFDSTSPLVTVAPTDTIPVMMIHGKDDTIAPYFGGPTAAEGPWIHLSFAESVALWVDANQCDTTLVDSAVVQGDSGRVFIERYNTCEAGAEVVAISIENHKHSWPSKEDSGFDGTAAIVEFFRRHAKP